MRATCRELKLASLHPVNQHEQTRTSSRQRAELSVLIKAERVLDLATNMMDYWTLGATMVFASRQIFSQSQEFGRRTSALSEEERRGLGFGCLQAAQNHLAVQAAVDLHSGVGQGCCH